MNKDNPLEQLTLAQVDAAFSKTRRRGYKQNVTTWGQLGLTGDWANRPISLYGRNSASGTYGFFKEHSLGNGDYKDSVKEQPGSASVVQGVTEDRFGMGYSGIGYKTSGVKVVALADKDGDAFSSGSYEDVKSGKYPLNRFLYIYINRAPGKPLDPLVKEFCKLMFSQGGPGGRRQGRLPAASRGDREAGAGQAGVARPASVGATRRPHARERYPARESLMADAAHRPPRRSTSASASRPRPAGCGA